MPSCGINLTHGLKTIQAWICSTSHADTLTKNGNETSKREWMCDLFEITFWIFPILEYYFLGLPNLFSHFNQLLGKTVPKLLEGYGTWVI